eukprot:3317953-Rhodomonas_salina.1
MSYAVPTSGAGGSARPGGANKCSSFASRNAPQAPEQHSLGLSRPQPKPQSQQKPPPGSENRSQSSDVPAKKENDR